MGSPIAVRINANQFMSNSNEDPEEKLCDPLFYALGSIIAVPLLVVILLFFIVVLSVGYPVIPFWAYFNRRAKIRKLNDTWHGGPAQREADIGGDKEMVAAFLNEEQVPSRFWRRGKKCPGLGVRCDAAHCNNAAANCYTMHALRARGCICEAPGLKIFTGGCPIHDPKGLKSSPPNPENTDSTIGLTPEKEREIREVIERLS